MKRRGIAAVAASLLWASPLWAAPASAAPARTVSVRSSAAGVVLPVSTVTAEWTDARTLTVSGRNAADTVVAATWADNVRVGRDGVLLEVLRTLAFGPVDGGAECSYTIEYRWKGRWRSAGTRTSEREATAGLVVYSVMEFGEVLGGIAPGTVVPVRVAATIHYPGVVPEVDESLRITPP
jgi:hypothetical protein